jgi:GNAT superfamily N-acetyltransferase
VSTAQEPAIRLARWEDDFLALWHVDHSVRAMYRDFGVEFSSLDGESPSSAPGLFDEGTMTWVATDECDVAVGYVFAFPLDDAAHVEQLSVHPDHQRQGVGTALLEIVNTWAAQRGPRALTVITFADVAWNAPWYRRIGFTDIPDDKLGDALRRLRDEAQSVARDWKRVVMRRAVTRPAWRSSSPGSSTTPYVDIIKRRRGT